MVGPFGDDRTRLLLVRRDGCAVGDLVSLGRFSGVADPFIKLRGIFAWVMWRFYYLLNLVGWQNRLQVALNRPIALLFPSDSALSFECTPECVQETCP